MELYDIHTHQVFLEDNDDPYHSSILDVYPLEFEVANETHSRHAFSCGIHPWYSEDSENQLDYLKEIISHPRIIAIGETGIDKLKGPDMQVQIPVFLEHIKLSELLQKPLIIHCVKAWEELIKIHRDIKPTQPWIIHGFRSNPDITQRLVDEGFMFSVGDKLNVDSLLLIPIDRLFCETDEDDMDIREVYTQVADVLGIDLNTFAGKIAENVRVIFPNLPRPSKNYEVNEVIEEDE